MTGVGKINSTHTHSFTRTGKHAHVWEDIACVGGHSRAQSRTRTHMRKLTHTNTQTANFKDVRSDTHPQSSLIYTPNTDTCHSHVSACMRTHTHTHTHIQSKNKKSTHTHTHTHMRAHTHTPLHYTKTSIRARVLPPPPPTVRMCVCI